MALSTYESKTLFEHAVEHARDGWYQLDGARKYGPFETEQDAKQCDPLKPGSFSWLEVR
jgi:hypothetical protein